MTSRKGRAMLMDRETHYCKKNQFSPNQPIRECKCTPEQAQMEHNSWRYWQVDSNVLPEMQWAKSSQERLEKMSKVFIAPQNTVVEECILMQGLANESWGQNTESRLELTCGWILNLLWSGGERWSFQQMVSGPANIQTGGKKWSLTPLLFLI